MRDESVAEAMSRSWYQQQLLTPFRSPINMWLHRHEFISTSLFFIVCFIAFALFIIHTTHIWW